MASKGPFVLLTLDFVVAISALRISGSYLELDEEPESTGTNTEPVQQLCLPPYTSTSPTQTEISHLHTQTFTHWVCYPISTAQRQAKAIVQSSTPQKVQTEGAKACSASPKSGFVPG